jgi:flagellar biosynthesis protein FlhG
MAGSGRAAPYAPRPGVIVVGSGKGGVGTSVVSTLIAVEAARRGERVLLVDADEAVGSLHMMLGISDAGPGLGALRGGLVEPEALVVSAGPGLVLLPGGGGGVDATLANATGERRAMLRRVSGLFDRFSTVVVDGGSRLESVMAACGAGAERLICVTSPDRISLAANYAMFKIARARFETLPVELIVNGADERRGRSLHAIVRAATQSFLGTDVRFGGTVPRDDLIGVAIESSASLFDLTPASRAASAVGGVVQRMLMERHLASGADVDVVPIMGEI